MSKLNKIAFTLLLIIVGVIFIQSFIGVSRFDNYSENERIQALETAVTKAAVQCYAIEGSYPPDIDYLAEHYGLVVNKDAYFYHYEIVASNILPVIAVYKKW
ncbi:MAG: hypothetical protein IBX70_02145 [Clostridia bacterium]|nr:hypothetical protein [Clostridia bacterium]